MSDGLFITFEGGEGAGKTTLIESIAQALTLEGHQVLKTREPGGTVLGEQIRSLLLHNKDAKISPYAELCLFLASRAQHIFEVIIPALNAKKIVLCDRFNDSSIAYQGIARHLGKTKVADTCAFISENLQPHLTFYLDLDPRIGLARVKRARNWEDRIEAEALSFHEKIRNAYLVLSKEHPKRIHVLDATKPPERVFDEAMHYIWGKFHV